MKYPNKSKCEAQFTVIPKEIADKPELAVAFYAYQKKWRNSNGVSNQTQSQFMKWANLSDRNVFSRPMNYNGEKVGLYDLLAQMGVHFNKIKDGEYSRYIYTFDLADNYFTFTNDFMELVETLGINKWAFLLKMKAICINATDTILMNKSEIAQRLNISRPTLNKYLNELSEYITKIKDGYKLTVEAFKPIEDDFVAITREFVASKESELKSLNNLGYYAISLIRIKFDFDLVKYAKWLLTKFKTLPKSVDMSYFCTALNITGELKVYGTKEKRIKKVPFEVTL